MDTKDLKEEFNPVKMFVEIKQLKFQLDLMKSLIWTVAVLCKINPEVIAANWNDTSIVKDYALKVQQTLDEIAKVEAERGKEKNE